MFKNSKSPFVPKSAFAKRRRSSKGFNRFTPSRGTPSRTPLQSKLSRTNIKVCVRVRPPNEAENVAASRTVVNVMDSNVLVFDAPPEDRKEPTYFKGHALRDPTAKRNRDLTFGFDYVFGPEASNEDVFENTTKLILNTFMEGTNCSVFAYGATGAGKTHTMLGKPDNPGIMLRTMVELYRRIDECREDTVCDVHITYLEVYNEAVRDLLNPENGALNIREDSGGLTVAGLSSHKIEDSDELFEKLAAGNKNRTQHSTDANAESSRSHAVFQVYLKQTSRVPDLTSDVLYSKLSLIDLAGSERATVTKNSGDRMREGANINRSLLSLGNCINALAEGKKGTHIPFRDSKLTRILKDSLGGSCKTIMIANVSPSSLTFEDTYNTLKYADRAKKIKAELRQNKFRVDSHIHQYGVIAEAQRTEIEDLKRKLEEARLEVRLLRERPAEIINAAPQADTVITGICQGVAVCVDSYVALQQHVLELEAEILKLRQQTASRILLQKRVNAFSADPNFTVKSTGRTDRFVAQTKAKIDDLNTRITSKKQGLLVLKSALEQSLKDAVNGANAVPQTVLEISQWLFGRFELTQVQQENKSLRTSLDSLSSLFLQDQKLINDLLPLVREQHMTLKGWAKMDGRLQGQFDAIERLLRNAGKVSWSDQEAAEAEEAVSTEMNGLSGLLAKGLPDHCAHVVLEDFLKHTFPGIASNGLQTVKCKPTSNAYSHASNDSFHVDFKVSKFVINSDSETTQSEDEPELQTLPPSPNTITKKKRQSDEGCDTITRSAVDSCSNNLQRNGGIPFDLPSTARETNNKPLMSSFCSNKTASSGAIIGPPSCSNNNNQGSPPRPGAGLLLASPQTAKPRQRSRETFVVPPKPAMETMMCSVQPSARNATGGGGPARRDTFLVQTKVQLPVYPPEVNNYPGSLIKPPQRRRSSEIGILPPAMESKSKLTGASSAAEQNGAVVRPSNVETHSRLTVINHPNVNTKRRSPSPQELVTSTTPSPDAVKEEGQHKSQTAVHGSRPILCERNVGPANARGSMVQPDNICANAKPAYSGTDAISSTVETDNSSKAASIAKANERRWPPLSRQPTSQSAVASAFDSDGFRRPGPPPSAAFGGAQARSNVAVASGPLAPANLLSDAVIKETAESLKKFGTISLAEKLEKAMAAGGARSEASPPATAASRNLAIPSNRLTKSPSCSQLGAIQRNKEKENQPVLPRVASYRNLPKWI